MTSDLYGDGGCVHKNPSSEGGAWAWVNVLPDDSPHSFGSGFVSPEELGTPWVSNNAMELQALIEGLEKMPENWTGCIHSDSQVALTWLFHSTNLTAIPEILQPRLISLRQRTGGFQGITYRLLGGHPTEEDLRTGIRAARKGKSAKPCSKWNVFCDEGCGKVIRDYLKNNPPPLSGIPSTPRNAPISHGCGGEPKTLEEEFNEWMIRRGFKPRSILELESLKEEFEFERRLNGPAPETP